MSVCVGLCSSACNCIHLLASACVCVHPCVSAFACLQPRAFHHKVELIDSIYLGKLPSENWVPPKESLLGLGQPWEADPWECDDEAEEYVLVAVSQHINELVTKLHSNEDCDKKLKKIRQDRLPKQTQKQTDWAVFV